MVYRIRRLDVSTYGGVDPRLKLNVDKLRFEPKVPRAWPGYSIYYRYRETIYHIRIVNNGEGNSIRRLSLNGHDQPHHEITLINDQRNHEVEIELE